MILMIIAKCAALIGPLIDVADKGAAILNLITAVIDFFTVAMKKDDRN